MKLSWSTIILCFLLLLSLGCNENNSKKTSDLQNNPLKSTFSDDFKIGVALNEGHIIEENPIATDLVAREFNAITPENIMKWMYIHPKKDQFDFEKSDAYVAFGEKYGMHIVGHTLVWHSQLAPWVSNIKDSISLKTTLNQHITSIVERYKGRIQTWDVVNEAFNEDGTYRNSIFYDLLGEEFIAYSFALVSQIDPNAKLVYNDYNLWKPKKREGVVRMIKMLKEKGIKINAVGMQGHYSIMGPNLKDIENSIIAFNEAGVKVDFSELDITVLPNPWELDGAAVEEDYSQFEGNPVMNPYVAEHPTKAKIELAVRYKELFQLFLKHREKIDRVTFWGLQDGDSWLNNWPIQGRTNYPLLFNREYGSKIALDSVLRLKK